MALYKIKKKSSAGKKATYLVTVSKWDFEGKFFTLDQLLKLLKKEFNKLPTLPSDWEVVEYQLIEIKETNIDTFIKYKSTGPWLKDL